MNYKKGFIKQAGLASEIAGTVGSTALSIPLMGLPALGSFMAGAAAGPKGEEDMAAQNKKMGTNFIPMVAPYRLGRRMATKQMHDSINSAVLATNAYRKAMEQQNAN